MKIINKVKEMLLTHTKESVIDYVNSVMFQLGEPKSIDDINKFLECKTAIRFIKQYKKE
jgi:hypothetical protein